VVTQRQSGVSQKTWKFSYTTVMDRDSSVGIATRYRLDSPGSNIDGGEIFRNRPDYPGTHLTSYTPSSSEVKERVYLYLYSPSGPSWLVLRWALVLPLHLQECDSNSYYTFVNMSINWYMNMSTPEVMACASTGAVIWWYRWRAVTCDVESIHM